MGSLKEIKSRIQSVQSTQKITAAMKIISSVKLHKAQKKVENIFPYAQQLQRLMQNIGTQDNTSTVLAEIRPVKRVAIIPFSSNGSLCGGFNANIAKQLTKTIEKYASLGREHILIFPVGKKVSKASRSLGFSSEENFDTLSEKPNYELITQLADNMVQLFMKKNIDRVEIIYYHFRNKGVQVLLSETLLPIEMESDTFSKKTPNYLIEPNAQDLLDTLVPAFVRLKMYTALLHSHASEHAARTIAMQVATDNANDMLQELSLLYNKSRQQVITSELLDIVGGSFK